MRAVVEGQREFRIEAQVGSSGAVEPFAQVDDPCFRKDLLRIEHFAPARVTQYGIGNEAALAHCQHGTSDGLTMQRCRFHLTEIEMLICTPLPCQAIANEAREVRHAGRGFAAECPYLPAGAARPRLGQMTELPGEVLVNDKNPHASPSCSRSPIGGDHRQQCRLVARGQVGLPKYRRRKGSHGVDKVLNLGIEQRLAVRSLELLDVVLRT